jgi:hypothetical protein
MGVLGSFVEMVPHSTLWRSSMIGKNPRLGPQSARVFHKLNLLLGVPLLFIAPPLLTEFAFES